jgi:hypothetical protein
MVNPAVISLDLRHLLSIYERYTNGALTGPTNFLHVSITFMEQTQTLQ